MLRLPTAIRSAVAIRWYASISQSLERPPSTKWSSAVAQLSPSTLSAERCHYATVHSEDTERIWSQYGKSDPAGQIQKEAPPTSSVHSSKPEAAAKQSSNSPMSSEMQELLTILNKRARKKASSMRPKSRDRIKQASGSADPLSALRRLEVQTRPARAKDANIVEPSPTEEVVQHHLLDVDHIVRTMSLPTKEQYPRALDELFEPNQVSVAIHNVCQALKISMETDVDYVSKKAVKTSAHALPSHVQVCTLKLDIPDICHESAVGEGLSKQNAKQAAWLHMVAKLHKDGTLTELFPDTKSQAIQLQSSQTTDGANVDERTKIEEKDAKAQIYNYAASFGLIPHFETKRFRRVSRRSSPLFHVTIRLDGRNISVTGAGKDVYTAEVAAAVLFKEQAEKQHLRSGGNDAEAVSSVLNMDTAKDFFEFYRSRVSRLNLEVEHEQVNRDGITQNRAQMTVDGVAVGEHAMMSTKKEAESTAYLVAAVQITHSNPHLLGEFEQMLSKGRGKVLRPVRSVDLKLDFSMQHLMRTALVEARKAGLSDTRQLLRAEDLRTSVGNRQRQQPLSQQKLESINEYLLSMLTRFEGNPALKESRSKKEALPMNQYRDQVLSMVSGNPYSIIVGATGSGKTTQVPQILFEDAIRSGHGSCCNIICTQPRRIAATSVAKRVAVERDETLRKTVGYQVRFDSKPPHDPYGITYCTTGVLLEKLKHSPDEVLDTVSHLIIDEVHERDLLIDFLMIVLKRAIRVRNADGRSVPKVVLMSATLDTELFANYFRRTDNEGKTLPCPSLSVPGRTYPVREKYLGSIIDEIHKQHGPAVTPLLNADLKTRDYLTAENAFAASHSKDISNSSAESIIDWKRERQQATCYEDTMTSAASEKEDALVPISLVVATISHICTTSDGGAILVFLPGLEEILNVQKMLLERNTFGINYNDTAKFQICPLHSTTSPEQQAEIFEPSPPGRRKIILSTNLAETSVTVTEVKYIVDTGKLREKRYDQLRRITKLQCVWESRSNAKQRAGRAGRVQDGFYYALYSKERAESLRAIGLPELLRTDLQETCLAIKSQRFDESIASFLAQAIEPPSKQAVNAAIENLINIEAFTEDQNLTALGRVLSCLPVHPSLGKMIILGVIFKCLDPMIILGAAANERSLFWMPSGDLRADADRAHRSYAGIDQSDQLAFLQAFNELRTIKQQYGERAAHNRARENYLHSGAYRTISQGAGQIEEVLVDAGLISRKLHVGGRQTLEYGPSELNRNAENAALIKCLLIAGLRPNIAVKLTSQGLTYRTQREKAVIMHPGSLNAELGHRDRHPNGTLFTYGTLAKSNDGNSLFLRESTQVSPLDCVLFGGELQITQDARLEMDDWLPFFVKAADRQFATKLLLEFRKGLDRVLHRAFQSLGDLSPVSAGRFTDDPVRERFTERVIEILGRERPDRLGGNGSYNTADESWSAWDLAGGTMGRL